LYGERTRVNRFVIPCHEAELGIYRRTYCELKGDPVSPFAFVRLSWR